MTRGNSTRLPDLASQGPGLPLATRYTWTVLGIAPLSSVDAVALAGTFNPAGPLVLESVADSTFTTK